MKIELNSPATNQVSSDTVALVNHNVTTSTQSTSEDRITFHSASIESLTSRALESPAVRTETVQSLRQSVSSGQYNADTAKTANAIVNNP
jgi:anti-sigma28 factor (negative regulator of flagellin synthesis)